MTMDEDYTIEEAVTIIRKAIERKKKEVADLEKRIKRFKREDRINEMQELIDYLKADTIAYITVLADMTDDDSLLEGLDLDTENVAECPVKYDQYISGLSADDLENELEADEVRAEYCDEVVEMMCYDIGENALKSKKMVKFLLEDPYALEALGELIFYDDYLYDMYRSVASKDEAKSKGKGGKDKKKKKKD
ncbi:MAG TPA: hypothetical protein IAC83_04415 [Euryarchaeota archaeon]|nr:hypothetical protein [Euryarchaeota archaeon]